MDIIKWAASGTEKYRHLHLHSFPNAAFFQSKSLSWEGVLGSDLAPDSFVDVKRVEGAKACSNVTPLLLPFMLKLK